MRLIAVAFCLLLATAAAWAAPTFPPLTGRVTDEAQLLDAVATAQLTEKLAAHEQQTGNQLVVVTVKSLQGYDIAEYGYQLGRAWGIGQKDKNNGVLLLVAPNERQVRIEVGYGLEDRLTDAMSRLIIERAILPEFRTGNYAGGIAAGVDSIIAVLGGGELPTVLKQPAEEELPLSFIIPILILFLILRLFARGGRSGGVLPLLLGGLLGGRGRGGGGRWGGGGGSFGGGGASGRW